MFSKHAQQRSILGFMVVVIAIMMMCVGSAALGQDGAERGGGASGQIRQTPASEMTLGERLSRQLFTLRDAHLPASLEREPMVRPAAGQALSIDHANVGKVLELAPMEFTAEANKPLIIAIPDPEGQWQRFAIVRTKLMEDKLAAEFPDIRVVVGQGIDDPHAILRADVTLHGFQAQVLTPHGDWYIDPISKFNPIDHTSYYRKFTRMVHRFVCQVAGQDPLNNADVAGRGGEQTAARAGANLRIHRIAVAASGEYTAFFGGTVAAGQAAIVTAVNRVTGVFERELAVRFIIVANNSSVVYTNAATDPYDNSASNAQLTINHNNLNTVIGAANYDIGHLFNTGGGGRGAQGVCVPTRKGQGATGQPTPVNDPFWIDFVAHEIGHQYGANHTFNSIIGSCNGNRVAPTAMEIGSGSTIMAYAGICAADNLQPNSDAYFHSISFDEISSTLALPEYTCGPFNANANQVPSIASLQAFRIPTGTPFFLTASATDGNNDPLTYCWEDRALGPNQTLAAADNGQSPLVRSRNPSTSPTRFVPQISTVLAGTTDNQEKLPAIGRVWPWRVTVRDNRANGGGVNTADTTVTVVADTGPFRVTNPQSAVTWNIGSSQTVTWDVAGTQSNGINTSEVAIEYTINGGATWLPLVPRTANDGSETFVVVASPASGARLRVRALNNIYYAVAQGAVTFANVPSGVVLAAWGTPIVSDRTLFNATNNNNGVIEPGESEIEITVPVTNAGATTSVQGLGFLSSLTPTVTVIGGLSTYGPIPFNSPREGNAYRISVSPSHPCGAPINLSLFVTGGLSLNFSLPTGTIGAGPLNSFAYTGAPVPIEDLTTVNVPVVVSGLTGDIDEVRLTIGGTSCVSTAGATTVGIDHTYVSDLVISLVSPEGTVVRLINERGFNGRNFCNTVLSASGMIPISSILASQAPFSGTFVPDGNLGAFNGENPNGTWFLRVTDTISGDEGNVRAFSVQIATFSNVTCQPPINVACPTISQQPQSVSVCGTSTIDLSVMASAFGPITYRWQRDGVDLVDDARITGSTTANLMIASPRAADLGQYRVILGGWCTTSSTVSQVAVVSASCLSPSDIGSEGGAEGCDGLLDNNDFIVFINLFFTADPRADVGIEGGAGGSDGLFDNNDFIVFIDGFFAGC